MLMRLPPFHLTGSVHIEALLPLCLLLLDKFSYPCLHPFHNPTLPLSPSSKTLFIRSVITRLRGRVGSGARVKVGMSFSWASTSMPALVLEHFVLLEFLPQEVAAF